MRALFLWLASLMATSVAVAISFQWLDRPIALMIHGHLWRPHHGMWEQSTRIPDPLIPLAVVVFVLLGLRALLGRPLSNYQAAAFVCSLSVIAAEATKDQLKFIFGRTWPETWVQNNPSFIRDGVYGFHFLHGGSAYQSFPSGHMAAACAVLSVLWLWYPRLRWFCATAGLAVGAGLIGANYHFLSDVIAGAFVGTSTGWMATAIWQVRATAGGVRNVK
jgi:membrane-associated phospholipid phosphatase